MAAIPASVAARIAMSLLLIFSTWIQVAGADVYRWTDERGRVVYSDKPPDGSVGGGDVELLPDVSSRSQKQSPSIDGNNATADSDAASRSTNITDDEKSRLERCVHARHQLTALETTLPAFSKDAHGHRHYIEDEARPSRIEKFKKDKAMYCRSTTEDVIAQDQMWNDMFRYCICERGDPILVPNPTRTVSRLPMEAGEVLGSVPFVEDAEKPERRTPASELERLRKAAETYCRGAGEGLARTEALTYFCKVIFLDFEL